MMLGPLFGLLGTASTRLTSWGISLALWLIGRPGGWAVVAAAILVWVRTTDKS